jgi:P pilus assembly chaperone PapD
MTAHRADFRELPSRRAAASLGFLSLCVVLLGVMALAPRPAAALEYAPTRIIMSERNPTDILRILNRKAESNIVRLSWTQMRMEPETGRLREVTGPEDLPDGIAANNEFVIFAPRRMAVPAQGTQVVRFMARPPADLPPGEYRSHLRITEEPRAQELPSDGGDGLTMSIQTVRRTTIPVIYRHGDIDVEVELGGASLTEKKGKPAVKVTLLREGRQSLYGDAEIVWHRPQGDPLVVAQPRGIAVYPEIASRTYFHRLDLPEGVSLSGGTLTYRLRPLGSGADATPLIETEIQVR